MTSWTVDQVGDWLKTNGFEKYIKTFKDEDIDGTALIGLQDDDILKLLSILHEDGTRRNPKMRTQRKFRAILDEYKTAIKQERRKKRNSSPVISLRNPVHTTTTDVETYSKTYTVESISIGLKFFVNESICSNLTKYFLTEYNVKCHIPRQDQYNTKIALHIKLSGVKENVRDAWNDLQSLFKTVKTKTFNNEDTDTRIIRWSQHIYCDSVLGVLQKIFFDKKKLTVWEKTSILSGYYIVHYVSEHPKFGVSEEFITRILNTEITYAKDIVIPNVNNIQIKFRKELDEFINDKKERQYQSQIMAIIYCQYPSQVEMKISFFGLRNQVDIAKKQIKVLMNKHRMRTIIIGLDSKQREYILDNYVHELKNIEIDYKDDNIKIQIRENSFTAPQYLIMKIKQLILSMIFQTTTLIFRHLQNAFIFTEKNHFQLKTLAQTYNCEINKINEETKQELILLPSRKNTSTSKHLIQQSNQFYSSLSIPRKLSISNNTIEIHKSYDLPTDITVISTTTDATKEKIDPINGNGYYESDIGKKVLYIQWFLPRLQETNNQMKKSIEKFISTVLQQIDLLCTESVKTIAFSTTDWENYGHRKQLIEGILNEIKHQLETKSYSRKILFIFDKEQNDLFNEFSQGILSLQTEKDDYEQFIYPISTTLITLKTSGNSNISRCENAIHDYIKKYILTTIALNHPFDSKIWNQYMINTFYKYCLEKNVLPNVQQYRLELIGPVSAVSEVKQKYEMMSEIERQRRLVHTQISESTVPKKKLDVYNIILNCCSDDMVSTDHLADRLVDEGYLVSIDYSDKTSAYMRSSFHKTDVIIICFSYNYSENENCLKSMMELNKSEMKIIPIVLIERALNQDNDWLQQMTIKELFYESFEREIEFQLKQDLDLDYDKLLIELLQHTKPGAVGRFYPKSTITPSKEEQQEENVGQQSVLPQFTPEQIQEKEQIYAKQIAKILEKDKIPNDELTDLIESLKIVLEDCATEGFSMTAEESIPDTKANAVEDHKNKDKDAQQSRSDGENSQQNEEDESQLSENEEEEAVQMSEYLHHFLSSVQRWLEKASIAPVIKGNLPPFTLTGDFNDAAFPISLANKVPWWMTNADLSDFNHSLPGLSLRGPEMMIGSWCNYDEIHHYFQKFIDKDIEFRKDKHKQQQTNTNVQHHSHFKTTIKKGTTAWDITANREVLAEYEKRLNGKPSKPNKFSPGWNRLLDQSVKTLSKIKEGELTIQSDEVQGKIGQTLKTHEETRKREKLDDPNNTIWTNKRYFRWRREFIQLKIKNTIEWQKFCEGKTKKQ